ncbi:MAG: YihY/virulence factor BrkB family protein [Devosia sp.]
MANSAAAETLVKPDAHGFQKWKSVLLGTVHRFGENRATLVAAGVTYFLLLALFPALTAVVSIYGLFADGTTIAKNMALLSTIVPAGGLQLINDQLARLTANGAPTLGFALFLSLAVAVWSASSGVKSVFEAMNIAYEVKETRNFLILNAVALGFTFVGVVVAAMVLAVVVVMPIAFGFIGLRNGFEWLVQAAGYPVLALVLLIGIAALYRFGPSRPDAKWRWISPGAVVALVVIGGISGLFSWYTANFAHFDKTYGSVGALIGFLFWMWVSNTAVIAGAELNAELDRQTGKSPPVEVLQDEAPSPAVADSSSDRAQRSAQPYRPVAKRAAPLALVIPVALASLLLRRQSRPK